MSGVVEVWVDRDRTAVQVGTAHVEHRRNRLSTSFRYDESFLADPAAYDIDPALPRSAGHGVTDGLPGALLDCAPDRWGRRLIAKRLRASPPSGTPRTLTDLDYLLGVADLTRQGALRFKVRGEQQFADASTDVPKMIRLPELLHAADHVARDDDADLSAIKMLLDAGTGTLGGARPKASVLGDDGLLYIAKFPHPNDEWDLMAWEKTALDLAAEAGIHAPSRRITQVDGRTVLLLQRFDRDHADRIGYMSAMTLIEGVDGHDYDYLEVAEALADASAQADTDLADLWRRMAFSVAVHNTDDHLRNHGVLRDGAGWRLSPIFDVNPDPEPSKNRVTSIGWSTGRADEVDALFTSAEQFGLSHDRAGAILAEVEEATRGWRSAARSNGVPESELRRFEGAFEDLRDLLRSRAHRAP